MLCLPLLTLQGSSPLARGTHHAVEAFECVVGLIPARAGNTVLTENHRGEGGAHPRSRGEH